MQGTPLQKNQNRLRCFYLTITRVPIAPTTTVELASPPRWYGVWLSTRSNEAAVPRVHRLRERVLVVTAYCVLRTENIFVCWCCVGSDRAAGVG